MKDQEVNSWPSKKGFYLHLQDFHSISDAHFLQLFSHSTYTEWRCPWCISVCLCLSTAHQSSCEQDEKLSLFFFDSMDTDNCIVLLLYSYLLVN